MAVSSDAIRVLRVIAETGSFSKAASVLHRVPSAISYSVRKMEETLNVELFERSAKGAIPTKACEYILANSDWIIRSLHDLEQGMAQVAKGVDSQFTIALNYIVNPAPVTDLMSWLQQQYPATQFSIRTEVYNGSWDALYEGRADLVIGAPSNPPTFDGISTVPLGEIDWQFVVGASHPLAGVDTVLQANQVRPYASIVVLDSSTQLQQQRTWALTGQRVISVANLKMVLDLIAHNVGVGFLPTRFVAPYVEQGLVCVKSIHEQKQPVPVCYAWRTLREGVLLTSILNYLNDPVRRQAWLS